MHPDLVRVINEAIKDSPVDFTVVEGVRTVERQKELYAYGRTVMVRDHAKARIVTHSDGVIKKSNHQPKKDGFGYAVDIYPFVGGRVDVEDGKSLLRIGHHIVATGKRLGINVQWGQDWKTFVDPPHFELIK